MKAFNPIHRSNVSPVDIDTFGNTYRELEQGHQRAVQFESALKTEMAKLDLNEAEDAWRQQKIDGIRATLSENTKYGNAAGAVDDLVRAQGDIFSDPALLGRLRAQQDYKTYIDNLDKRTDLSEDYKNYYRARTKYNYQDITDDNGKVVGGTKWQPNERPVSQIDMNEVFTTALKYISPDSGTYENTMFLDPNTGRTSKTYTPGAELVRLNTVTNSYEKLGADKLQAAVTAAMNANPAIKASLEQDFKIDKWKHEQNPDIFTDAYNNKGVLKTFNEYVQDKIDPFITAKKYNNFVSKNNYNDSLLNSLWTIKAKAAAKGNNTKMTPSATPPTTDVSGPLVTIDATPNPETLTRYRAAYAKFNDIVNNKYKDLNLFVTPDMSLDDVNNLLNKTSLGDFEKDDILKAYVAVNEATAADRLTLQQATSGVSQEARSAYKFLQELQSGSISPIDENDDEATKRFKQENANIVNAIYGNGDYVGVDLADKRMFDAFVSNLGGREVLGKYNIEQSNLPDGRVRVTIPKEMSDGLSNFMIAAGNAYEEKGVLSRAWNSFRGKVGGNPQMRVVRLGANKSSIEDLSYDRNAWMTAMGQSATSAGQFFRGIAEPIDNIVSTLSPNNWADVFKLQVKKLTKNADEVFENNTKEVPVTINLGVNPRDWQLQQYKSGASNSKEITYYDKLSEDEQNKYITHLRAIPGILNNKKIYVNELDEKGYPTGRYRVPTDEELRWLDAARSGIGDNKIIADKQVHIPTIKGNHPLITLLPDDSKVATAARSGFEKLKSSLKDTKSNIGFIIIDGINDPSFNAYNNSLEAAAIQTSELLFYQNVAFDVPIIGQRFVVGTDPEDKSRYAIYEASNIESPVNGGLDYTFVNKASTWKTFDAAARSGLLRTEKEQLSAVAAYKDLLDAIGMSEGMRNSYINAYIAQYFQNNETAK
jgi:hypothetical protein